MINQIDKWEKDSINQIKQTAEESRQKLIHYTTDYVNNIENKLHNLAKQLKEIRQEKEFNKTDLNQIKETLTKLGAELTNL